MPRLIIVGAGIAGLYLAEKLKHEHQVTLVEKRRAAGGKIKTRYDDDQDTVRYECGPWRVSDRHRRLLALLKRYGLRTEPLGSDKRSALRSFVDVAGLKQGKRGGAAAADGLRDLSHHDRDLLDGGVRYQAYREHRSGYLGIHDAHHLTHPYESDGRYLRVVQGFGALARRIAAGLGPAVRVMYGTKVLDIKRTRDRYRLTLDHGEALTCEILILASPPATWTAWSLYRHLRPLAACVAPRALHHIYARALDVPRLRGNRDFHLHTSDALAQVISSNNRWFQLSYSGGRLARFWYRLRLGSTKAFHETLRRQFRRLCRCLGTRPVPVDRIESHYFSAAYHVWLPRHRLSLRRMLKMAARPHPVACPNLYVAGEAFSSHQGWIEGALETAQRVLRTMRRPVRPGGHVRDVRFPWLIYDSRLLNVGQWMHKHPGSKQAIEHYLGRDVTQLFDRIHADDTFSLLCTLQHAWIQPDGTLLDG